MVFFFRSRRIICICKFLFGGWACWSLCTNSDLTSKEADLDYTFCRLIWELRNSKYRYYSNWLEELLLVHSLRLHTLFYGVYKLVLLLGWSHQIIVADHLISVNSQLYLWNVVYNMSIWAKQHLLRNTKFYDVELLYEIFQGDQTISL